MTKSSEVGGKQAKETADGRGVSGLSMGSALYASFIIIMLSFGLGMEKSRQRGT